MILEVVVIVYLVWYIIKTLHENKLMPPGPFPLPVLGNIHHIGFDPPFTMDTLYMTYGDVYRITLPIGKLIIINSAELAREALVTKKDDFAGRPTAMMYPVDVIFEERDIVAADFGAAFVSRRKLLKSALRSTKFAKDTASGAVGDILELIEATDGKPFSLKPYVLSAVVGYLWEGISSTKYRFGDPPLSSLVDLIENISSLSSQGNRYQLAPLLRHFRTKFTNRLEKVLKIRNNIVGAMTTAHRQSYKKGVIRDVTDAFISAYDTGGLAQKNNVDTDIMHFAINILFGASTTTTAIVTWFALYVALDSDLQSKLQRELDSVVGKDCLPCRKDIERLPYLQSTLCEVIRHSSFMPFLIPHKTTRDTTIKGYHLPKETVVLFNLYRINRDPAEWQQPTLFKSERFVDADGKFVGWSKVSAFMPFGLGTRSCPGKDLGKLQVIVIAASLIHQFTLRLADQGHKPTLCDSLPGAIRYSKDYKLVAKKRSGGRCSRLR